MRMTVTILSIALAACLPRAALAATPAGQSGAPASAVPAAGDDVAALRARVEQLGAQLDAQQREMQRLQLQVEWLELAQRGRGLPGSAQQAEATAQADAPAGTAPPAAQAPQEMAPIGQASREAEDAQRREQDKALVVREHAPLFERRFTFDAGLTYSYYDRRQLSLSGFLALDAIFLGTINLDQAKASVATLELVGRYGLTDRINLEASVPYVWRDSRFVSAGAGGASSELSEVGVTASGIGDASLAVYYQVLKESERWPDLVASLRVRGPSGRDPFGIKLVQPDPNNDNLNIPESLPTGTGVWSATANLSVLRTYDPVILFANLGYTYYRPRDFSDISPILEQVSPAEVALGNAWQFSGGLAIALNDRSAVSFSVSSAIAGATHTTVPGGAEQRVAGSSSNSTALNIGGTYALPSGWTFNGQVAAGLTPDAPNFVVGLRSTKVF